MRSKIEILATADDLPQQLAAELSRGRVSQRLGNGSLGEIAPHDNGQRFAPELSYGRHFGPAPSTARPAAVVALLFRRAGRWRIPLTVRHAALGRHGGQISLPGGAVEPGESAAQAAKRELAEELGVGEPIDLLGRLSDCYVFASDFLVTPWLATTTLEPVWQPYSHEVERVVELPLEALFDPNTIGTTTIQRGPLVFRAPCHRLGEDCVWGATSIILSELEVVLRRLVDLAEPDPHDG